MSEEWSTINKPVKKANKKEKISEEIYFLSDILYDGGCLRCINKTCKIQTNHGIDFPEIMCRFVEKPISINGMDKVFLAANLDFNGKKPKYTICNYINGRCKNCEEERIKYVDYNGKKILLCYPSLENVKYQLTVGIHADIKLVLKGPKYDVSLIPSDIDIQQNDEVEFIEDNEEPIEIWPSLNVQNENNDKKMQNNNAIKDFSKLNFSVEDKLNVEERLDDKKTSSLKSNFVILGNSKTPISEPIFIETQVSENIVSETPSSKNKISLNVVKKSSKIENNENKENDSKLEERLQKERELMFLRKINFLENENKQLTIENMELRKKSAKDDFIIQNNEKYDEILYNINNINNYVTKQYVDTEYSEYLLV